MNHFFRPATRTGCLLFFMLLTIAGFSQVVINEVCLSNVDNKLNDNGRYDDWVEFYNDGPTPVNMEGYGFSDEISKPFKFTFPAFELGPGQKVLLFASDINRTDISNHWETAVSAYSSWKYFAGTSQPDTNWRNLSFNHSSWSSGNGGIGFGDSDDNTRISTSSISVMMRKEFFVPDTGDINSAVFNIDYDDGFVAYLNGTEIARANLGTPGDRPAYNVLAFSSHEAMLYQGNDPDSFYIDPSFLKSILLPGLNVLAVQVHNNQSNSGDLSAIPFLSFGMLSATQTFSNVPSWFNAPSFQYFQAPFKLSRSGETVLLTDNTGMNIDQEIIPLLEPNHSMGRSSDGSSTWCVFTDPTPLGSNSNSNCYPGYASDPVFSLAEGFYNSSRSLSLSTSMSGTKIRYTTDGSEPTSSSTQFNNSISLNSTKTIRVKVFKTGYLPSPTFTKTYFINEDIHLPVFTISTDPDNLWDYNSGIYATGPYAEPNYPYKGANFWQDWEVPAGIEYYDKDNNKQLSFNANIEIFGNYSQAKPQKSFEIKLSDEMGTSSIEYALFSDKPQLNDLDNFVLRNAGTDWNTVHFRDALMQRVMKNTHSGYLGAEPAVVFLNGEYWGVYSIHENHDQHWIKNNHGLGKNEIDMLLEGGSVTTKFGSDQTFWDLIDYALSENPNNSNYYSEIDEQLDIKNFVDYMIAETYYNNGDWMGDWTNNIKLWRPKAPGGKWKYLLYDLDMGLGYSGSVNDSTIRIARDPISQNYTSDLFDALLQNNTFKSYFINRYADLINTIFKPSNMLDVVEEFEDVMDHDMNEHFDKWDSFNGENFSMSTWNSDINSMENFINSRPNKVRDQILGEFGLQSKVTLTLNVSPAGAGRIQISTVTPGSYPWSGVYFRGNPVTITAMPNPGYSFDHWRSNVAISSNNPNQELTINFTSTDQITAYFDGDAESPDIAITEINYHSGVGADAGDWIELYNYGSVDLDISGWKIRDKNEYHTYTFPVGTVIEEGEYLVVAEDLTRFESRFPQINNVSGPLGFGFSNSGDEVRLFDYLDDNIITVEYADEAPWPGLADGEGYTLELVSPQADPAVASNWFAGCLEGSPGRAYSAPDATVSYSGSTTFCDGLDLEITAANGTGNSYQWNRNGNPLPGETQRTFYANASGTYNVTVSNQGCSVNSGSIEVTVLPQGQAPSVTDNFNCGPTSFTFQAQSNDTIFWFDDSGSQNLGIGNTFTTPFLNATTNYIARASSVCPSSPVTVTAYVNPVPVIHLGADTSIMSGQTLLLNAGPGFNSYLWSTGETTQQIQINSAGNYSVMVTDMNNCNATDAIEVSVFTGTQLVTKDNNFLVYPLPARDQVIIEYYKSSYSETLVRLFNPEGRLVSVQNHHGIPGFRQLQVDLKDLSSGIYYMSVRDEGREEVILIPLN